MSEPDDFQYEEEITKQLYDKLLKMEPEEGYPGWLPVEATLEVYSRNYFSTREYLILLGLKRNTQPRLSYQEEGFTKEVEIHYPVKSLVFKAVRSISYAEIDLCRLSVVEVLSIFILNEIKKPELEGELAGYDPRNVYYQIDVGYAQPWYDQKQEKAKNLPTIPLFDRGKEFLMPQTYALGTPKTPYNCCGICEQPYEGPLVWNGPGVRWVHRHCLVSFF